MSGTGININLTDAKMQELVTAAILQGLDEQKRELLISQAIAHLWKPNQHNRQTLIQELFNNSATGVARELITAKLKDEPEFVAKIKGAMEEAINRVFNNEEAREKLISQLANSLGNFLNSR